MCGGEVEKLLNFCNVCASFNVLILNVLSSEKSEEISQK